MTCSEIVKKYLRGLNQTMRVEETDSGCIVYTPFMNPNNELIMTFIEKIEGKYRISDMSQTDEFLFLHGLDIKPFSKAEYYFNDILKRYEIKSKDTELYVDVDEENLAHGINAIIGAINSIDHLIYTLNPRISPNFQAVVSSWLDEMKITYRPKVEILSGLTEPVKIDFEIPRHDTTPIFMQALHASMKSSAKMIAYRYDFQINDLTDAGFKFQPVVLLDDSVDEENVWETAYPIFKKKTNNVIFWNDRAELLPLLATV
jgi:hypothetical protein